LTALDVDPDAFGKEPCCTRTLCIFARTCHLATKEMRQGLVSP
jgi:hypothetical protein